MAEDDSTWPEPPAISPWYWLLRIPVAAIPSCGILVTQMDIGFAEPSEPAVANQWLSVVLVLVVGLAMILPNRWTPSGWPLVVRLVILLLAASRLTWMAAWFALGFLNNEKHWLAIPFAVVPPLFLAFASPVCLLWRAELTRRHSSFGGHSENRSSRLALTK